MKNALVILQLLLCLLVVYGAAYEWVITPFAATGIAIVTSLKVFFDNCKDVDLKIKRRIHNDN